MPGPNFISPSNTGKVMLPNGIVPADLNSLFINNPNGGVTPVQSFDPNAVPNTGFLSKIFGSGTAAASPFNKTPWGAILAGAGILGQGIANRDVLNQQQNQEMWGLNQTNAFQDTINKALGTLVNKIKTDTPAQQTAAAQTKYDAALKGALGPTYGDTGGAYGKAYTGAAAQDTLNQGIRASQLTHLLSQIAGPNAMRRFQGYAIDNTRGTVDQNDAYARELAAANQGVVSGIHENPYTKMVMQALQII